MNLFSINISVLYILLNLQLFQENIIKLVIPFSKPLTKNSLEIQKNFKANVYATLSSEYFATRVNYAVKRLGSKNHLLIRVLISRSETDMPQIKQYFRQLYGKHMLADAKVRL